MTEDTTCLRCSTQAPTDHNGLCVVCAVAVQMFDKRWDTMLEFLALCVGVALGALCVLLWQAFFGAIM